MSTSKSLPNTKEVPETKVRGGCVQKIILLLDPLTPIQRDGVIRARL